MITFFLELPTGQRQTIEVPEGINLSLMEVLKASECDVMATCGGMALCATCHIEVMEGDLQSEPNDQELDMLDTLPDAGPFSRLSCQIRVDERLNGTVIRFAGELVA